VGSTAGRVVPAMMEGVVDAFLDEVRGRLGPQGVVTDPDVLRIHSVDWTGRWAGETPAVLRPASTEEVAEVVRGARRHGVALVAQGGRTGLVGGSVPTRGEVLVDLRRLDRLDPVDGSAGQVTAGAGVTLERLQAHVAAAGWAFGVDIGARGTATVGGMVATNAGGNHVVRHGPMRHQVLGVEAVLGTGEVLAANLAGLVKDNTGYDLAGLLCGSEGTLGIVTAARLALVAPVAAAATALVGYRSIAEAVAAAATLRRTPDLHALELVLGAGLDLVAAHHQVPVPLSPTPPAALLVEVASTREGTDLAGQLATAVGDGPEPAGAAVATTPTDRARLWRWREGHPEAAAGLGIVHKADVTLPATATTRFLDEVPALVERCAPGATTLLYGHLGDGNVHVNVVGPDPDDDRTIDAVLDLVLALGGSISAEHGIGTSKVAWLERQRGTVAVSTMAALRRALDPDGVLNPAVLTPRT
jgi:FAD/FMN-containing dehydrogenase